ncbi:MAG: hypothetical protein ACTSXD_00995, partial [Candidatus Heimdallarchaeaceae archaeon]
HSEQVILQQDGLPAAGWITNLRREKDKLLADIKGIPKKIYELIKRKAYGRFSAEIYWNLKDNGKNYRRVLKAVALLGGDTPAVTTLDDFIDLYELEDYEELKGYIVNENRIIADEIKVYYEKSNSKEDNMKDLEKLEQELKQKETELKKYKEKVEELEKYKKKTEFEKQLTEVTYYLKDKIREGKILPSQFHFYTALALDLPEFEGVKKYEYVENDEKKTIEYKSNFELIKKIIENTPKIVDFTEKSEVGEKIESEQNDLSEDEKLDRKVRKYMKEHNIESYKEALYKVLEEEQGK